MQQINGAHFARARAGNGGGREGGGYIEKLFTDRERCFPRDMRHYARLLRIYFPGVRTVPRWNYRVDIAAIATRDNILTFDCCQLLSRRTSVYRTARLRKRDG